MSYLQNFISNLDVSALINILLRVIAALLCITLHELSHGAAAYLLGDRTAKDRGRLTINPIRHIDPLGLLMMIVAGVGWAKPVPIDPRNFKRPKQGMAITALAGPVCNLVLSLLFLLIGNFLLQFYFYHDAAAAIYYLLLFFLRCAVLSLGLGLFNLIPIPPLDGSKVLFSILPDRFYFKLLSCERYISLVLFALVFLDIFDTPLSWCINHVLYLFCIITGFPPAVLGF